MHDTRIQPYNDSFKVVNVQGFVWGHQGRIRNDNQHNFIEGAILWVRAKNFSFRFLRGRNRPQGDFDWNIDQESHHIRNFKVRSQKYAQAPGGWSEWNLRFRGAGLAPSYERSHPEYMVNVTVCCWNAGGSSHLRIRQQDKILALTFNLTWPHVAVRKCKSGTDVVRICNTHFLQE
jgi:hypothetical protein